MNRSILSAIVALSLISIVNAGPNDVLYRGKFYRDAAVTGFVGDMAEISSRDGKAQVPWTSLPATLRMKHAADFERYKHQVEVSRVRQQTNDAPGTSRFAIEVVQVVPNGVLAQVGRKVVFVEGFPDGTEGQQATVVARRDKSFTYTDTAGARRTVERWVFLRAE